MAGPAFCLPFLSFLFLLVFFSGFFAFLLSGAGLGAAVVPSPSSFSSDFAAFFAFGAAFPGFLVGFAE
jgi:hypothetical protein